MATSIKRKVQLAYDLHGQTTAFDVVNKHNKRAKTKVPFEYCRGCECESPAIKHECLICGQETNKEPLVLEMKITGKGTKEALIKSLLKLVNSLTKDTEMLKYIEMGVTGTYREDKGIYAEFKENKQ